MKTLVIMRHAKADKTEKFNDFERPLTEKGSEDAKNVGIKLKNEGFVPDLIVTSSALRTFQTAENVAKMVEYSKEIQSTKDFYYGDEEEMILHIENQEENVQKLMLIGHNPTCEHLVYKLLGRSDYFEFKTSTAYLLETNADKWKDFSKNKMEIKKVIQK